MAAPASAYGTDRAWRLTVLLTLVLTLARLSALFVSPLELYPDEAQYWLWSRHLDFGYYSKPPLIAWTIWASTALGGDGEPWIKLFSPLFHAGATLAVFGVGKRLYDASTALVGAAFYALMPGVQLSSVIAATDAPLLFFCGVTLLCYVTFPEAQGRKRLLAAAGVGAFLGLAFLSKYAALYIVIGIALHLTLSAEARRAWTLPTAALALGACALILAPNLLWNASHGFATLHHTAANAAWGGRKLFNFDELGDFLASQFGVFGPVPFAVLIGGGILMAARRRLQPADVLLLCFALPPLLIVTGQAFVSRANANWSGAGYLPGAILVAAWLLRWRARAWIGIGLAFQGVVAVLFIACLLQPRTAELIGVANSFKRAKGWSQITERLIDRAERERGKGLSAIAVNDRFLYNAAAYYGRDYFGAPGTPPLVMWLYESAPKNQAETEAPLTVANGGRVLAVALENTHRDEMKADFSRTSDPEIVSVRLDYKRKRRAEFFIGEGFAPTPRDPVSGRPRPP